MSPSASRAHGVRHPAYERWCASLALGISTVSKARSSVADVVAGGRSSSSEAFTRLFFNISQGVFQPNIHAFNRLCVFTGKFPLLGNSAKLGALRSPCLEPATEQPTAHHDTRHTQYSHRTQTVDSKTHRLPRACPSQQTANSDTATQRHSDTATKRLPPFPPRQTNRIRYQKQPVTRYLVVS